MQYMRKFLEFFFHHLYHSFAWGYDLVAWAVSLGQWNSWVFSILPHIPQGRILEIGFGTGHLIDAMDRKGLRAVGLDESWQMTRIVARNQPGARIVRASASKAPFPSAFFSGIAATFPAPYIFSSQTAAEIFRLLAPGGILLVLLAARPKRNGFGGILMQGLFRLTGEAPSKETDYRNLFSAYLGRGFELEIEWQATTQADLLLIRAVKPDEG